MSRCAWQAWMSENSDVAPSVDLEDLDLDALCSRALKKLTGPLDQPLPVASHRSAVNTLLKIRDAMLRGLEPNQGSKMALLCAGINCCRRIACEVEDRANADLLRTTQTLLFSLLALAEPRAESLQLDGGTDEPADDGAEADETDEGQPDGTEGDDVAETADEEAKETDRPSKCRRLGAMRDDQQLLLAWKGRSLAEKINEGSDCADSSWSDLLRSDARVSRAVLKEAQFVSDKNAMVSMQDLAVIFFRCSSQAMASSMLSSVQPKQRDRPAQDMSFLTLDTVSMMNEANENQEEKLYALADAAESEAGQAILRDLILSFKLPQHAVNVRRTVCLSRESNTTATRQFPEVLNVAHEAAMRGSLWSYQSDPDPIHKMSALLAGFALVMVTGKDDIRKGSAFKGRVSLPFLDCPPPPPHVTRLALLPETGEWCVYNLASTGKPRVKCRKRGYQGFCEALLLVSKLRNSW